MHQHDNDNVVLYTCRLVLLHQHGSDNVVLYTCRLVLLHQHGTYCVVNDAVIDCHQHYAPSSEASGTGSITKGTSLPIQCRLFDLRNDDVNDNGFVVSQRSNRGRQMTP